MSKKAYGTYSYGQYPYQGGLPATITPADLQLGIPFIAGNDRYQVVVCADRGTTSSTPQFRYWFANGQQWGHELAQDSFLPSYFSIDEDGNTVVGELRLANREFEFRRRGNAYAAANVLVDHVVVDFVPRPAAITSETVSSSEPLGFTGNIEAYGLVDYSRQVGSDPLTFSGTEVSDTFTYQSTCGEQASDTWPNMRSVKLALRFNVRAMSIRVVLTEIRHVEIVRVAVLGSYGPTREV